MTRRFGAEIVTEMYSVDGGTGTLVETRLLSNPEVNLGFNIAHWWRGQEVS